MNLEGLGRWCPHRRKDRHFYLVSIVLLLIQAHWSNCDVKNDFEQLKTDDLASMLEEEALMSVSRNRNNAETKHVPPFSDTRETLTYTSLHKRYEENDVSVLSEEILSSDLAASAYNLRQERIKREVIDVEGSVPVNECEETDDCSGPYEKCIDLEDGYECTCIEGYTRIDFKCYAELYPMSSSPYRIYGLDGIAWVNVEDGIPFASKFYYRIFISTNGIISFGRRYGPYSPVFPTYRQNILCPYWSDIDVRYSNAEGAGVFYDTYTSGSDLTAITEKTFGRYAGLNNFDPTWALVVTWKKVAQYGKSSVNKTVTFQVVLATDGQSTKVLYIYNKMNWEASDIRIVIGYESSFSRDNRRRLLPVSNTINAYYNDRIQQNTDFRNVFIYDVGGHAINYRARCRAWYNRFQRDYANNIFRFNRLPTCPCSGFFMLWHPRFFPHHWQFREGRWELCWRTFFNRRYFPLAKECCYERGWWLSPDSGYAMRYHPNFFPGFNYEADVYGKDNCCDKSNTCDLYRNIRPRRQCSFIFGFIFGWGFGDPHITTLDGRTYIFNGWGEYTMIEAKTEIDDETEEFYLQTRTERAINKEGNVTTATVFSAFAASDNNDIFNVELNPNKTGLIIYRNGNDLTKEFYNDVNFTQTDDVGGLTVNRDKDDVVGNFASGISVRVGLSTRLLTISVGMPNEFKTKTKGLMGNNDGDKTNDFIFPNGTVLPDNTAEAVLYAYGQTWAIDPTKSFMRYPLRKNNSDFFHPEFEPLYYDQASDEDKAVALEKCGNDETNLPCIFDYLATKDEEVSSKSGETDQKAQSDRNEQANTAPQLSSSQTRLEVTIGEKIEFALNATDQDSGDAIKYTLVEKPSSLELSEDDQDGTIKTATASWTPEGTDPVKLSVVAQDSKNATSETVDIEIVLCDGCSGNGTCNFTQIRGDQSEVTAKTFQLAACMCETGYTGDACESEVDGCEEDPCSQGQDCIDLSPEEEVTFNRTYNCSACPDGFEDQESKCEDINECNGTNNCDQICENTQGSYICSCRSGYRRVASKCDDIDECVEASHDCDQICTNTEGGFDCSCESTFDLDDNNKTCTLNDTKANPCLSLNCTYGCKVVEGSTGPPGTPECFCQTGYEINRADNESCKNIDECKQNVCVQDCTDSEGSFTCSCFDGYTLAADKVSCEKCSGLLYGENCVEMCDCGDRYSECDHVRGCICLEGWRGVKCDQDIDECTENPNTCKLGFECENTDGSYTCKCPTGYTDIDEKCEDVDECITDTTCQQKCKNVLGSFTCDCNSGYKLNGTQCEDVDECADDVSDCGQKCVNNVGSYNCECEFGYRLMEDRASCEKVEDVCAELNLDCSQGCTVKEESEQAFCFCNLGYYLGTDNKTCLDIVECDDPELNKCSDICTNTKGGFSCSCPIGKKLANDMVTCEECDDQHWGESCTNECGCGLGSSGCDKQLGCQCKTGWLGVRCDEDRDECAVATTTCPANSDCVNNPGSFMCVCRTGYLLNETSSQCDDIDECKDPDRNTCDQLCDNTAGSFVCRCRDGFIRTDSKCEDIDECETSKDDCQQLCRNTEGSYACSCRPGFILNTENRRDCISTGVCVRENCTQQCEVGETETCFCDSGFELDDTDGITCTDIDECAPDPNPCTAGGATCQNKVNGTGYECTCEDGFKLQTDGVSCLECEEGKWGTECSETCVCELANTEKCLKNNGTCDCRQGWEGTTCDTDIDECTRAPPVDCGANAECKNNNGSYVCQCVAGFYRKGEGCEACDGNSWGTNCQGTCTCGINSVSCDAATGDCTCNDGWEGSSCETDKDECTENTTICSGTPNSECLNNNGSFTCECQSGYLKDPDTGDCNDLVECLDDRLNNCTQECENTVGSYTCSCSPGYTGTWNDCTDIDECKLNTTICDGIANTTCKNKPGTFDCECTAGLEKNTTENVCQDINECEVTPDICDSEENTDCQNTEGSHTCVCKTGYRLRDSDDKCIDIDECTEDDTLCSDVPNTSCENVDGGYECRCVEGYVKNNVTDVCDDVNECQDSTVCDDQPNTKCSNTVGNYTCDCKSGFTRNVTSNLCDDVDECLGDPGCAFSCLNFDNGSYTCVCDENEVLNIDGRSCDATSIIVSEITIEKTVVNATFVPGTAEFVDLVAQITTALTAYFRGIFGDAFVSLTVWGFRRGSVIANYSTEINTNLKPNAEGEFLKAAADLVNTNLSIDGTPTKVLDALLDGKSIDSSNLCETFKDIKDCGPNRVCEVKDSVPVCKTIDEGNDYRIIIGLSIGIPIFVVALATIIAVIILKSRRSSKYSSDDEGNDLASRPFASQIATRGYYNRNRAMYSPDTLSVASSESDRRKRNGRSSFRDSAWYSQPGEAQEPKAYDNANFSWDFLYKIMPPNETFEIRRPQVAPSESPLRSTGRKNYYTNA